MVITFHTLRCEIFQFRIKVKLTGKKLNRHSSLCIYNYTFGHWAKSARWYGESWFRVDLLFARFSSLTGTEGVFLYMKSLASICLFEQKSHSLFRLIQRNKTQLKFGAQASDSSEQLRRRFPNEFKNLFAHCSSLAFKNRPDYTWGDVHIRSAINYLRELPAQWKLMNWRNITPIRSSLQFLKTS